MELSFYMNITETTIGEKTRVSDGEDLRDFAISTFDITEEESYTDKFGDLPDKIYSEIESVASRTVVIAEDSYVISCDAEHKEKFYDLTSFILTSNGHSFNIEIVITDEYEDEE